METQDQALNVLAAGVHLGPALVRGVTAQALLVEVEGELQRAEMALAFPYEAQEGDIVLAFGQEERFYIVGVLKGQGQTRLDFPGSVAIRAQGVLSLESAHQLDLAAPKVTLRADRFESLVRVATERFVRCYRWVKNVCQTVAGRQRTIVEKQSSLHAERIVQKAKGDVVVDGKEIRLG